MQQKKTVKGIANKYLDQALDRFTTDLSKKLDPVSGKGYIKSCSEEGFYDAWA